MMMKAEVGEERENHGNRRRKKDLKIGRITGKKQNLERRDSKKRKRKSMRNEKKKK